MSLPYGFDRTSGFVRDQAAIFDELVRDLEFTQPAIRMFGKSVPTPRLIAAFGDAPYTYSGITHNPAPWHPAIRAIGDVAAMRISSPIIGRVRFNTCLVNYYRDGADSIGWHADDEPELGPAPVIASVSLGAPRTLKIRANEPGLTGRRTTWDVLLEGGDLLAMHGPAQVDYQHSLPKTARAGARINLTFRWVNM